MTLRTSWGTPPGETLAEMLKERDQTLGSLAFDLSVEGVREVTVEEMKEVRAGTRAIDDDLAILLGRTLGPSAAFWRERERAYRAALARDAQDGVEWQQVSPGFHCVGDDVKSSPLVVASVFNNDQADRWTARVRSADGWTAKRDFEAEPAAKAAAEQLALRLALDPDAVAYLHKQLWAARNVRRREALALVKPEDAVAYLTARGWTRCAANKDGRGEAAAVTFERARRASAMVSMRDQSESYPGIVANLCESVAREEGREEFEVLADLLPMDGPWNGRPERG